MANITTRIDQDEVFLSTGENLVLSVFNNGTAATINSASYILYDSGLNIKSSGNITPSSNTLTVSILSTYYTVVEENCRVEWSYTISSTTYKSNNLFDVVKTKILNTVTDTDIKENYPLLTTDLPSTQTNYDNQIKKAFGIVKRDIKNKGRRPHLIVDGEQIKPLIEEKSLSIIFEMFSREVDDIWWTRYLEHEKKYNDLLRGTNFFYDSDSDAVVDMSLNFASIGFQR